MSLGVCFARVIEIYFVAVEENVLIFSAWLSKAQDRYLIHKPFQ